MVRTCAALALAACLLVSGCSGVLPGAQNSTTPGAGVGTDAPTSPTAGTTTAPVGGDTADAVDTPSAPPDPEGTALAFEDGRLANASALVAGHVAALNRTGFGFESSAVTRARDAAVPVSYMNRTARVGAGGAPFVAAYNQTGGLSTDRRTALWHNGSFGASKEVRSVALRDDAVLYRSGSAVDADAPPSLSPFVPLYLRTGSFSVVDTAEDGTRTLAANRTHNGTLGSYEVRAFEARATVDEAGRIRSLSVDATLVIENITFDQRYRFALSSAPASVERPSWVDTAVEKTPRAAAHVEDDYMVVTNTGNVALGPDVYLVQNDTGPAGTLDEPLPPGETVYLYQTTGDTHRLVVADSPPTERRASLSGSYRVEFGGRGYFRQVSVPVNASGE